MVTYKEKSIISVLIQLLYLISNKCIQETVSEDSRALHQKSFQNFQKRKEPYSVPFIHSIVSL